MRGHAGFSTYTLDLSDPWVAGLLARVGVVVAGRHGCGVGGCGFCSKKKKRDFDGSSVAQRQGAMRAVAGEFVVGSGRAVRWGYRRGSGFC